MKIKSNFKFQNLNSLHTVVFFFWQLSWNCNFNISQFEANLKPVLTQFKTTVRRRQIKILKFKVKLKSNQIKSYQKCVKIKNFREIFLISFVRKPLYQLDYILIVFISVSCVLQSHEEKNIKFRYDDDQLWWSIMNNLISCR